MTAGAATLSLAGGLGVRPDGAVVERSRLALARIESEVSLRLTAIAGLAPPAGMDIVQWQTARAAIEVQAKEDAEKAKVAYKSVIMLDELHQIYENVADGCKMTPLVSPSKENVGVTDARSVTPPIVEAETKIAAALLMADAPRKKLDLSGLLLRDLPRSIPKLSMLVKLDLSNNNLEFLPDSVTSLVNLIILDVHSNQLASLPDSVGRLAKLKVLNVSSNSLVAFPDTIENCRALEEVSADFNRITRLPECMGFELANLQKLSVHSNRMTHLPSSTSHMTSLRVLDVHLNNLRRLPEDVGRLVNLEYLNASKNFNNFVALPESIGGLRKLTEMDVSYNQIRRLPNSIGGMEKLQRLAVEGNPLVEPLPKIVEHGVEAVKQYLRGTINDGRKGHGASSWLGHLVRCGTGPYEGGRRIIKELEEEEGSFSSPRGFFSPRRLFSSSPLRHVSTPRRTPHHLYSPLRV